MLFDTFIQEKPAGSAQCARYQTLLPEELTSVWRRYGFGSLLNGCLRLIDPEEYLPLLRETYALGETAIPIFSTAFADLITWEKGRYLRMVQYKNGAFHGIAAGFDFFWTDLEAGVFHDRLLQLPQYEAAAARLGTPGFDECFGYVPLLSLGGSPRVENLRRCKMKEHIRLICQAAGPVGA